MIEKIRVYWYIEILEYVRGILRLKGKYFKGKFVKSIKKIYKVNK